MFFFMLALLGMYFPYRDAMSKRVERYYQEYTDTLVASLSTDELIHQTLVLYAPLDKKEFWQKFHPGGIFIFTDNIPKTETDKQDIGALKKKIAAINNLYLAKKLPPPLYAIDQEHGKVKRLREDTLLFPSALAIGEACRQEDDVFLAMLQGFYACRDLKKVGIQWNYAPVADLQLDRENPVIRTRSFGSDAQWVSKTIYAYIQGLHTARCLDTIKHFPGHGDTSQDSHKTLPSVKKDWQTLQKEDLFPFRYLVEKKKDAPSAIMTTHILFPLQDAYPSTLSKFWLSKVLRKDWGYQGIVVTDDMGMKGIADFKDPASYPYPQEVKAFIAGSDVLLIFNGLTAKRIENITQAMHLALQKKDITLERLRLSVKRTLLARLKAGVLDDYMQERLQELQKKQKDDKEETQDFKEIGMLQTLLKHSGSLNLEADKLSQRLPLPQKVNETLSHYGVRNLSAQQKGFSEQTQKDLHKFAFFTDASPDSDIYQEFIKNKIQPLKSEQLLLYNKTYQTLAKNNYNYVVFFHTGEHKLKPLLSHLQTQKRSWHLILYSVEDPFPYASYAGKLKKDDIFIDSLSDTPQSLRALWDFYIQKQMPPVPFFIYQNFDKNSFKNSSVNNSGKENKVAK